MPAAKRSITIRRPIAEVFAFVADGETGPRWRSAHLEIKHESGEGVGAIYRQSVPGPMGRRIAADYEVTAFEANKRLAFQTIAGPVRPKGEYRFAAANDATTVSFSLDVKLSLLRRLLMGRAVQRTMDAEMLALDKLKTVLERDGMPAPAAPEKAAARGATLTTKSTTATRTTAAKRSSAAKPKPTSRRATPKK